MPEWKYTKQTYPYMHVYTDVMSYIMLDQFISYFTSIHLECASTKIKNICPNKGFTIIWV